MNQSNPDTDTNKIEEAAAEWAVRLSSRALEPREQAHLDAWLRAEPRHAGALLRARAAWADLDRLVALSGRSPATAPGQDAHSAPASARRGWLIAASVVLFVLGSAAGWWAYEGRNVYISDVGEVRPVALSDGSRMVLNTATEATVHFDSALREINLASGEGLFQVAKDPKRPFVVHAGSISVRAVGTVFSVQREADQVNVTVTEGVVELVDGRGASGGRVIQKVAANERATVMDKHQVEIEALAHEQAERQFAWQDGMVDFAGEPLSVAVDKINRHNRRHIVVDDLQLAARPVVGVFRANDPEGFSATVSKALGLEVQDKEDAIHLRPAVSP